MVFLNRYQTENLIRISHYPHPTNIATSSRSNSGNHYSSASGFESRRPHHPTPDAPRRERLQEPLALEVVDYKWRTFAIAKSFFPIAPRQALDERNKFLAVHSSRYMSDIITSTSTTGMNSSGEQNSHTEFHFTSSASGQFAKSYPNHPNHHQNNDYYEK